VAELAVALPERPVVLARELTKKFEEWLRGTPAELAAQLQVRPRKGEFVVIVGPGPRRKGQALPDADAAAGPASPGREP